jgi:FMN reductase
VRVVAAAVEQAGGEADLILGRDLMLPIYDTETPVRDPLAVHFIRAVRAADAVVIASPGYHGAISGMMKNALDYIEDLRDDERPYLQDVPVGCVAVAYGWQATVSTLHSLRVTAHALRAWPTPLGATVNASGRVFDETGACVDDNARFQLETVARQVVDFATMYRASRAALVSAF